MKCDAAFRFSPEDEPRTQPFGATVRVGPEWDEVPHPWPESVPTLYPFQRASLAAMKRIESNVEVEAEVPKDPTSIYNWTNPCSYATDNPREGNLAKVRSHVGVLANPTGTGKSFIVAALCLNPCPAVNTLSHEVSNGFCALTYKSPAEFQRVQVSATLLIVPARMTSQWQRVLMQFADAGMTFHVILGAKWVQTRSRDQIIEEFNRHKVIVLSANAMSAMRVYLYQLTFDRIVIDEVTHISLTDGNCNAWLPWRANFVWFVSATAEHWLYDNFRRPVDKNFNTSPLVPKKRQSQVASLANWQHSLLRKHFVVRVSTEDVEKHTPMRRFHRGTFVLSVRDSRDVRLVRDIFTNTPVNANVLEQLHADRLQVAISALVGEDSTLSTLADAASLWIARQVDDALERLNRARVAQQRFGPAACERRRQELDAAVATAQDAWDTLVRRQRELHNRIREAQTCAVCLDPPTDAVFPICCQQVFCSQCLAQALCAVPAQRTCPTCRTPVPLHASVDGYFIGSNHGSTATPNANATVAAAAPPPDATDRTVFATKHAALLYALRHSVRAVLFVLDVDPAVEHTLTTLLTQHHIRPLTVFGLHASGTDAVMRKLETATEPTCLVVSALRQSCGFNMQFVDTLVMYQTFASNVETQIVGRAMRIHRTTPFRVYVLAYTNEPHLPRDADHDRDRKRAREEGDSVPLIAPAARRPALPHPPSPTRADDEREQGEEEREEEQEDEEQEDEDEEDEEEECVSPRRYL